MTISPEYADHPILGLLLDEASADPDTLGIILHGSRGAGVGQKESDYDLDRVLTDEAYERRQAAGDLEKPSIFEGDRKIVDAEYSCPRLLRETPTKTEWMVPAYASAQILLDKTGSLAEILRQATTMSEEQARGEAAAWYDAYLNAYLRGVKAANRDNELGARLQAADSVMHLVRALFALERSWPPYHDRLPYQLDRLTGQGWNVDELRATFLEILRTADTTRQKELQLEVEGLMRSRGYGHVLDAWGGDIERVTGS